MPSFLGKGWRFPVDINRNGTLSMSADEELIRESIIIVLGTAPGERVMRPGFGCEIHDLLFAPNNFTTAGLASYYVTAALQKWEPRIDNVEADAQPSLDSPNKMTINIRYTVRATNNRHNLVYPFYLRRSEDA